jgi:hypothetical protein
MRSTQNRLAGALLVLAALFSFLFLQHAAGVLSRNIGLFHDELWDFIPAVGMIRAESMNPNQEVRIAGYPFPIVSGPYQGALKTWTLAPLLMAFGTSPRFILSLNVLYGMIYLGALYWALIPLIGRRAACLVFAAPFFDTNFLLTAPMDTGPSIFQYIFISLAAGSLFRYMANSQLRYYGWTWLFSGCLLAQKLTAIPIVVSLIAFAVILAFGRFRAMSASGKAVQAIRSYLIIPAVLFMLPLLPHLAYFFKTGFGDLRAMTVTDRHPSYFASLGKNLSFVSGMFDGVDWYRRMTHDTGSAAAATPPVPAIFGVASAACSLMLGLFAGVNRKFLGYSAVCIGLCGASFLLFPVFEGLDRPWHFYVLTPLFICSVAVTTVHCFSVVAARWSGFVVLIRAAAAIGLAAGVLLGASHGIGILNRFEARKGVCMTSPAIYEAYRAVEASGVREIHALNYSLAYPLYLLAKGSVRVEDLAWTRLTGGKIDELFKKIEADPGAAIVYRFCGYKEVEGDWIRWLNREPEIFDFIRKLESEKDRVQVARCRDERQTEFVLIRRKGSAPGPAGSGAER